MKMEESEVCTLVGFMVNDAARLPCLLHHQRREAWVRRTDDIHGWGVGQYMSGNAVLRIQPGAAQGDLCLGDLVRDEGTTHLVAHVTSVAPASSLEDIQPFRWRRWLFAHDGVLDLGNRRAEMLDALPPFLLRCRRGRLDGEILFLHLMARLHREHLLDHRAKPNDLARCLQGIVGTEQVPINILTTNGRVLLAYCSGSLPMLFRRFEGIESCELCGIGGTSAGFATVVESHRRFKGICVASRPFWTGRWNEIPGQQILVVRPSLEPQLFPGLE